MINKKVGQSALSWNYSRVLFMPILVKRDLTYSARLHRFIRPFERCLA